MLITTCRRPGALGGAVRLAALLWLGASPAAQASGRELVVVGAHFARVFEQDAGGEFSGLGVELVRQVARQMDDTVRFELYPWPRAQAMLVQGRADILVGPYKSEERQALMQFSQRPFYQDQMVFYRRRGEALEWRGDYRALRDKRIVILNGWVYGAPFAAARPSLQVSVANSVSNGLKMLAFRHVDLFASNRRNTEPVIASLGLQDQLELLAPAIEVQNGYFAFPRDPAHDALRGSFDAALNTIAERGELRKLGQRLGVGTP